MIVTITPNPAIDRTAIVEEIHVDVPLRPSELIVLPGGKGINVARAVKEFGAEVTTTGFLGGMAGRWMVEALESEGLCPRFVEIAEETRTTYTTVDRFPQSILVYEPGPRVGQDDVGRLLRLLDGGLGVTQSPVVVAGSMPRGIEEQIVASVVEHCRERGVTDIVDTTGVALHRAVRAGATIVKINQEEAIDAGFGSGSSQGRSWPEGAIASARELVAGGASCGVVTAGAKGAVAADGRRTWTVAPPAVEIVSTVGSGDAFTAGLVVGLERGDPLPESLVAAAAAGAANAACPGAGRFSSEQQRALAKVTTVTEA